MKYVTTITTLIVLNIFAVINLLYFGANSRLIEKENKQLQFEISKYYEQLKINEVEFNLHNKFSYLEKLQNIYFDVKHTNLPDHKPISLDDFVNRESKNVYRVSSN